MGFVAGQGSGDSGVGRVALIRAFGTRPYLSDRNPLLWECTRRRTQGAESFVGGVGKKMRPVGRWEGDRMSPVLVGGCSGVAVSERMKSHVIFCYGEFSLVFWCCSESPYRGGRGLVSTFCSPCLEPRPCCSELLGDYVRVAAQYREREPRFVALRRTVAAPCRRQVREPLVPASTMLKRAPTVPTDTTISTSIQKR